MYRLVDKLKTEVAKQLSNILLQSEVYDSNDPLMSYLYFYNTNKYGESIMLEDNVINEISHIVRNKKLKQLINSFDI